jgi:hypothetical protein
MTRHWQIVAALFCAGCFCVSAGAQPPRERPREDGGKEQAKDYSNSPIVTKMMAFNKKKDGKLTKDEVTDGRLHRLFDQADTNKDGVVTKEELMALAAKLDAESAQDPDGRGPGGPGGPGGRGPGGRGGRGPGGPDGPGGRGPGGPPRFELGQVLPPRAREELSLTKSQETEIANLEKEVKERLSKILTAEQKKKMADFRPPRPGGFVPGGGGPGRPPEEGRPGRPPEGERPGRPEQSAKPTEPEKNKTIAGIQWFATWESGLREARRTGRPILLVSAAPHCAGVSGTW